MQYFGGKSRTAKVITTFLSSQLAPNQSYLEPFVGGAWILSALKPANAVASDLCLPLISLYKALQDGWQPPNVVTEDDYRSARQGLCEPHLQAFIGFGCSFSGKWFGGYARNQRGDNYAQAARNSLLKKMRELERVDFRHCDYRQHEPIATLIYCDPPYQGTTGYDAVEAFDWNEF